MRLFVAARSAAAAALLSALALGCPAAPPPLEDDAAFWRLPLAEREAAMSAVHPAAIYRHAMQRYDAGARDEAVMWLYVAQIRYRLLLRTRPELPAEGESALMDTLNDTVGHVIHLWAGGAPHDWARAIDEALQWDQAHDNAHTDLNQHRAAWRDVRRGFIALRQQILAHADDIRRERTARGLSNR